MSSCQYIPKQKQEKLIHNKKTTTSQSMEKKRIGLPVYLKLLAHDFGLTDNDKSEGIQRSLVTETTSI